MCKHVYAYQWVGWTVLSSFRFLSLSSLSLGFCAPLLGYMCPKSEVATDDEEGRRGDWISQSTQHISCAPVRSIWTCLGCVAASILPSIVVGIVHVPSKQRHSIAAIFAWALCRSRVRVCVAVRAKFLFYF